MDAEADRREANLKGSKISLVEEENISLGDVRFFSRKFWLLTFNCMCIYGGFYSFTNNANDLLGVLFNIQTDTAG